MDNSRVLIIGAHGQLGKALAKAFPRAQQADRNELDIASADVVAAYDWSGVDVIINAAAYTAVDLAETPEGRVDAWQGNAVGPRNLAQAAAQHNLTLVHISSDYVFDGTNTPHVENEPLSPLGVYGQTKAAGDVAVSLAPKHYIVRTSWVIGDGKNFVRTMMGLAEKNISPTVVADQVGRLTFTSTLADAISHLLTISAAPGVYNVSNDGESASWADVTRAIFKELGRTDLAVTDTTTEEYFASKPGVAPRPLNSALDLGKIKATGLSLRDWRDDLRAYVVVELSAQDQQKEETS